MIITLPKPDIETNDTESESDTSSLRTLVPPRRHGVFFQPIVNVGLAAIINSSIACTFSILDYLKKYDGSGTVTCFVATALTLPFLLFTLLLWVSPKLRNRIPITRSSRMYYANALLLAILMGAWAVALREGVMRWEVMEWSATRLGGEVYREGHARVIYRQVWVAFLSGNEMMLLTLLGTIICRRTTVDVQPVKSERWEAFSSQAIIPGEKPLRRIRSMSNLDEILGRRAGDKETSIYFSRQN